ncbi:MAG: hypothetical protein H0V29_09900 [Thermoleophilaceae bacterium]|nr:hypothetical protein [Thermoleophilaceae bacterium]
MRAVSALFVIVLVLLAVGGLLALRRRAVVRAAGTRRTGPSTLGLEVTQGEGRTRSLRGERHGHRVEVDIRRDSIRVHVNGAAHMFSAREELGRLVAGPHTPRRVRQALDETVADESRIWSGVQIEADGSGVLVRREGSRGEEFWPHYLELAERLVDIRPGS